MKKLKNIFLLFIFLLAVVPPLMDKDSNSAPLNSNLDTSSNLVIHYLDVGEGDSIFIELPNKETMLIDAGTSSSKDYIKNYIENLNYQKIDYVIGTHPHADHIGSLSYIIDNFEIGKIYLPKAKTNTKTYENLLLSIKNKGLLINEAKKGVEIFNLENLKIYFLAPILSEYDNLNNYSAVLKIVFNNKKFLFMGDAETLVEKSLNDVSADVIKIAHHGSDTSSQMEFLKKVNSEYAIISVGLDNIYDLPSATVISNLEKLNNKIYRTDKDGTIVITTDGENIEVRKEGKNDDN